MSVTYTTASQRDEARERRGVRLRLPEPLLLATSIAAVLAISLAAMGRLRVLDEAADGSREIVNLNTVRDPQVLEPALAAIFANAHDRRFAAAELFRFIGPDPSERSALPNVGALSRATVSTTTILAARHLTAFPDRLRAREDRTPPGTGEAVPAEIALFTAAEIAKLKPSLSVRTRDRFKSLVWLSSALYIAAFHVVAFVWRRRGITGNRVLLAAVHLLTAIGFAVLLSRADPLRDTLLFVRYAETIALGLALMTALSLVDIAALEFASLNYLPLVAALFLSVVLILFGSGPGNSAAKVNLGPVQPIEGIRLLLALFLAGYFGRRWELLRELRGETLRGVGLSRWINVPRGQYIVPVLVAVAAALLFFVVQRDLGPALFLCCVFLAVYAVARGRAGMAAIGLTLLATGVYVGYRLNVSSTLSGRVRMWQSPWDNAVAGGDQITHAIWAMATGGVFGTGLGLGDSRYLPAGHTDLILAAIGEELGAAGLLAVAILFAVLAWRGFRIARTASSDYGFFLATTLTLFLILPALIMASGVMGVTPLTGVVTPFLSYGGSAMLANFAAIGLLAAIQADRRPTNDFEPFRIPMRNLGAVLGVCAVALVAVAMRVQVLRADELVVKPHLGVHADGGRRFAYNPRIVEMLRGIPRGTIYDRRGLPLATSDAHPTENARQAYERIGVSLAEVCRDPGERCYPLGGEAFHLIGDARTAVNWSATNTSYVERDRDDRLRGFDDRASNVRTFDRDGRPMYTVHRDYRELVPVLRHRHQPEHAAVAAFRDRPRDVHLTIDAALQRRVAAIVSTHARRARGRAAAVVLDPATGAVLASVSYPWPEGSATNAAEGSALGKAEGRVQNKAEGTTLTADVAIEIADESDQPNSASALMDRARYGAYPPGSTFKLLVALAALGNGASQNRYTCARLADGRIGARISGWSRPVRDDVLDTRPHGTIDMHEGLVHSCNAYFAQLAVDVGAAPLAAMATRVKIPLTPENGSLQRVRDALPQVGYGQAHVVASPLRMATLAGAIAADGVLRSPYLDERRDPSDKQDPRRTPLSNEQRLADIRDARRLASYMRDVVVNGTARSLRSHQPPIAGKTGTAEVAGRPSHGWFVGFAPYGPATKRIAFAIVIEHAGYGGNTAAPAAADIVDAAVAAGLIGPK